MMRKALLEVLNGSEPWRRPIWFMRQAGRYLPEYRALRAKTGSFLDLCYDPALAAEVTLQPLQRFDLDAAIVFADILVVPHAMGVDLRFAEGEGPILEKVTDAARVHALKGISGTKEVTNVCETLHRVRGSLAEHVALIGFCGAPWTVASYMVGGGGATGREAARLTALDGPPWFAELIERLVEASVDYLEAQVEAGAEAVQIFDSWAGDLSGDAVRRWVVEPITRIRDGLKQRRPDIPVIVFARGVGAGHLEVARQTGAEALSLEPSVPLAWARDHLSARVAIQGNLDPLALLAGEAALDEAVIAIVKTLPAKRHIFNLGHGIRPETDPKRIGRVVELVRRLDG